MTQKQTLSRWTGEFVNKTQENLFLVSTWEYYKVAARNTFIIIMFMVAAFIIRDIIETSSSHTVFRLLILRVTVFVSLAISSITIHKTKQYHDWIHSLLLFNQILIALAIFILAVVREMPVAYLGINTILFTLIFYQFINNSFLFTIIACSFTSAGAVITAIIFLNLSLSDFAAAVLFLVPLNYLGIIILKSINRTRRSEYLALMDLKEANDEKGTAILELQQTLAEVKTLRGFLPICAKCKKIRDDQGYWKQIESYIEEHSEAQFSHGMCQECAEELYGESPWYQKMKNKRK